MKDTFDDFCRLFSLYGTFGLCLITLRSWLLAYLCGVQDLCDYSVLITINEFNEAMPELILWIILLPIFAYGLFLNSKILWNWNKISPLIDYIQKSNYKDFEKIREDINKKILIKLMENKLR